jgi:copper homeostasis protein
MSNCVLEIAAGSVADVQAAQSGGADRIELNCGLELGGLTPTIGLLFEVQRTTTLPIIAMARPRPGGFCCNDGEFRTMQRDIDLMLDAKVDGVAFGCLLTSGEIDQAVCRIILQLIGKRGVAVFHRAFDLTPDPHAALETLITLGFRRVMTSGQKTTALEGADLIADLIRQAKGRIEVMPAGGIKPEHVRELIDRTGCTQVHAGLRRRIGRSPGGEIRFGSNDDGRHEAVDENLIREMRHRMKVSGSHP